MDEPPCINYRVEGQGSFSLILIEFPSNFLPNEID